MLNREKDVCHKYDTDRLARNIWFCLLRDFRASEGPEFCRNAELAMLNGMDAFRSGCFPERGVIPPARFKRYAQLEDLLKKYRFANDVYSDEQLEIMTLRKYFEEQERLSRHDPIGPLGQLVCRVARKYARQILGKYNPEDTKVLARFGKKSSIGCPLSLAYIDHKLTDVRAFTGSSQCAKWFREEILSNDKILNHLVEQIPVDWDDAKLAHESLTLINVPKTWKTLRTITPLTLLSLFYSYGVGEQVTERLRQAGLPISHLQERHRRLVKKMSVTCSHATADLSAASDSLTTAILNRILPREWYCALKPLFTHRVVYTHDGVEHQGYTESVLPMGNGCTFPVETLIFYCLLRALGDLTGVRGIFSVYGDDLIYPSKLHPYVSRVFPLLGLRMNLDKTFVSFPFRESCGADYYRGVDVRPFFLRGNASRLTTSQYTAFLYKTYNGLLRRWDPLEIPSTLHWLLIELANVAREIYRVPLSYPDTAGIKTSAPWELPQGAWNLPWTPIRILFHHGSRWFHYKFLSASSTRRYIKSVLPYYWLSLQSRNDVSPDCFWETDYSFLDCLPSSGLTWEKQIFIRTFSRGTRQVKKKVVKYSPQSPSRTGVRLRSESGAVSDWT